ncbi:hypothetical protein EV702DRAFT_1044491 [Suillus placidus]|uniref:Uncharacterized protein n=1 Tax=Suillus placidus TaxID=48579 RepID=A0A9P6ZXJ7_9AGAM|nr:hypothetical protein EV702DRAFT_1044491 [Suillus placidus]
MSPNSIKCCASLDLTPIKAGKRIWSHSPTSASSTLNSDDDIYYSSKYSPPPAIFRRLGKKVEELEHYIDQLEASARDTRLKHAEELQMCQEPIDELQSTVDFQTTMLDHMGKEVERLEADNDCLRMENLEVIEHHILEHLSLT